MSDTPLITVWLVEDDLQFADTIQYVLNNADGIQCTQRFASFEELEHYAGDQDAEASPQLVLLDIRLPGITGIDAIGPLKEILPKAKIVMLTFFEDQSRIIKAMEAGADGYILKGAAFNEVIDTIRKSAAGSLVMGEKVAGKLLNHFQTDANPAPHNLSDRQYEVLVLMCQGLNKKQIAEQFELSVATVDNHYREIFARLDVHTAQAAVAKALRSGIVKL